MYVYSIAYHHLSIELVCKTCQITSKCIVFSTESLDPQQNYVIKTHVRGFFDTDLQEVSWHFATHEAVRPSWF